MDRITKKDFNIVWEWQRGRLQGQENYGYYIIVAKRSGKRIAEGFSSKRKVEEWLGPRIKIANKIRSGEIKIEKDETGKPYMVKGRTVCTTT